MKEVAMEKVGEIIALTLSRPEDEIAKNTARGMVSRLCAQYPLYADE
jgi:glycine hydroxymethyltransferase